MAVNVFLDTSVLLAGSIDFGETSDAAQQVMDAVAAKPTLKASTAWHCCLEFYSVATRLPAEFRLTPADALTLLEQEIFERMSIHDLPSAERGAFLRATAGDAIVGGRIYDAHIADVARAAGADVVVTDNRKHFLAALRHGLRVETPAEFLSSLKRS
jgi:predicted nucleic acid-binding protein